VECSLILCDWAEVINGKLYMMGAGWSRTQADAPLSISVAVMIKVPWTEANRKHKLRFGLVTEDGQSFSPPNAPGPIDIPGEFEVGRPPGLAEGSSLDTMLTYRFAGMTLPGGRYAFEMRIDDQMAGRVSFETLALQSR
jgi:hypothetical protein